MTLLTQVRAGRRTAIFGKFQSARGTVVNSFATADRLWTYRGGISQGPRVSEGAGMETSLGPGTGAAYVLPDRPAGGISVIATPASLRTVLDSNFGAFSGGAWTLASQVSNTRWLTLALEESVDGGTYKVVRLRDAWFHRVAIAADARGMLMLDAEYAARKQLNEAINAGGVTLPAAPAQPSDKEIFPFGNVTLTRDPASANVDIRFRSLRVILDQGLSHGYGQDDALYDVSRKGPLRARIELSSDWADETWAILTNSLAGTKQRYRIVATTDDATPQTFTLNLYDVLWSVADDGHEGKDYNEFRAVGMARVDGSGNFVSMALA